MSSTGGPHAIAPAEHRPDDDGGDERNDEDEAKHPLILPDWLGLRRAGFGWWVTRTP